MIYEYPNKIIKSPLRYPGGKGAFYPYFSELMRQNGLIGGKYFEPYAGGAGVALGLLSTNMASEVILNDADYHIYCFWVSVLDENERFIEKIQDTALSIKEWQNQKIIYKNPEKYSVFEVGFSTFFLNRTNRSGILNGAGPIGGYDQKGKWRLDARFNKDRLTTIIFDIGTLKHRITVKNMDAIMFFSTCLPQGKSREMSLVYIDPPYVSAGNRLYLNFYSEKDHKELAGYLLQELDLRWVITYDNADLIKELYSPCQRWIFHLGYSLQSKQKGEELLIAPNYVKLPDRNKVTSNRWTIKKKLRSIEI